MPTLSARVGPIWRRCLMRSRVFKLIARTVSEEAQHRSSQGHKEVINLADYPVQYIRNFSIIAHIDHGKSTLADRLLELTGTIPKDTNNKQFLDRLQVEKERGITVKAQTVSLFYNYQGKEYLLNLIDTPGHVDFCYEVARSLCACQGVILLVDANQGVQAQTVANFYQAFESELQIIPVMNKIDLKGAQPDVVEEQLINLFDFKSMDILRASAKTGQGVEEILQAVIERIPPPKADLSKPSKALLYDSWYNPFKGACCSVAVFDGVFKKGDRITLAHEQKSYEIQELGIMYPNERVTGNLYAGQVGYMFANMKSVDEAQVGDTIHLESRPTTALPGFKKSKPMVYAGIFPLDQSEHASLRTAIDKLTLNDPSVQVAVDSSAALGQGWRLGFLGLLHLEVFCQRLEQEHNASVIITSPNVPYKVTIVGAANIKAYGGEEVTVLNPCLFPPVSIVHETFEPIVSATIIAPDEYLSEIMKLIMERRGEQRDQTYIDNKRIMFKVQFPLAEVVVDFFDDLKSVTSGYASYDYEDCGYQATNLVKISVYINDKDVEELTQLCHVTKARVLARRIVDKLQDTIPQQLYQVTIQAKVGAKVLARADVKPLRKDVLAKCYGGDITRKMKLLRRQAEGKKRMRKIGNVEVPKDAFISVLKK